MCSKLKHEKRWHKRSWVTPHSSWTSGTPTVQTLKKDSPQQETEVQSTQLKMREKSANSPAETEEQSYAKQQLQVKLSESKLLRVKALYSSLSPTQVQQHQNVKYWPN